MNPKILTAVILVLIPVTSFSQSLDKSPSGFSTSETNFEEDPATRKFGFLVGWEGPYGAGGELAFLFKKRVEFSLGAGLGLSGLKFGIGSRYYFLIDSRLTPVIGAYLFHATGVNPATLTVNKEEAVYRIPSSSAILFSGGLSLEAIEEVSLSGNIGYSLHFSDKKPEYVSGSTASEVASFAKAVARGGLSLSIGLLISL